MKISFQLSVLLLSIATNVDATVSSTEGNFMSRKLPESSLRTNTGRFSDSAKARVQVVSQQKEASGKRTRSLLEKEKNSQFAMDIVSKNAQMFPSVYNKMQSTRRILDEEEMEGFSLEVCLGAAEQLTEQDPDLVCVCEENEDGSTLLSCAADCEFCDSGEEQVCYTETTNVAIGADGSISDLSQEITYISGLSFDVVFTRGEDGACGMSIDGTMCTSCVIESCGEPSLDCSNIVDDGTAVVDLCTAGVVATSPFYAFAIDTFECAPPAPRSAPTSCDDAVPLEADGSVIVASNTESEATASDSCAVAIGATVYYTVVGNGNRFRATTCTAETDFDTVLAVRSGTCDDRSCVGTDDDSGCGFNVKSSTFDWDTRDGVLYYIVVGGFSEVILEDSVEVTVAKTGTFGLQVTDLDGPPPDEPRSDGPLESCLALEEEFEDGDSTFDCSCADTSTTGFSSAVLECDDTCEGCNEDGSTCGIDSFYIGLTTDDVVWGIGSQVVATSGSETALASIQNYAPLYCLAFFIDGEGSLNYCDCELDDCDGELVPAVDCANVGDETSFSVCDDPVIESGPFQLFSSSGFDNVVCPDEMPVMEVDEEAEEAIALTPPEE